MSHVHIGHHLVGLGQPVFVIGEVGINHNGDMRVAKRLIREAHEAGAHAVKFQMRTVETLFTQQELSAPRKMPQEWLDRALARNALPREAIGRLTQDPTNVQYRDYKCAIEFSMEEYAEIDAYCRELGILWSASPWDEESVDRLAQFNPAFVKVASASLTNDALLRRIRGIGKPVILSTGGSTLPMIRHAVEVLGSQDLVILHCTAAYPKAESDRVLEVLNLRCIETLGEEFPGVPIGFSGNDSTRLPTYAAAVLGAAMVEKHITLNRTMEGSDHASSMEMGEFAELCRWLRELSRALGDGRKRVYPEEVEAMRKLRTDWGIWGPKDLSEG